jgi:hypothetical protein
MFLVSGRTRVPCPAARIIAFAMFSFRFLGSFEKPVWA